MPKPRIFKDKDRIRALTKTNPSGLTGPMGREYDLFLDCTTSVPDICGHKKELLTMWMWLLLLNIIFLCGGIPDTLVAQVVNSKGPIVDIKCSKCHTLKRVFVMPRSEGEWRDIVEEMMDKNPAWIQPTEAEQILREIILLRPERVQAMSQERKDYADARFLFIDRCTLCHSINRILLQDKTVEEWKETAERMRSEAIDYITIEDAERIARFLSERAEVLKEDAGGEIFVAKCLICHPGEQILLETHDYAGWDKIVQDMQKTAYKTFKRTWFDPTEAKLVVDLLVKTQGLETSN
jgi:hypothetical protein